MRLIINRVQWLLIRISSHYLIALGLILLLAIGFILYKTAIETYVSQYLSVRKEYTAYAKLLQTKERRIAYLETLKKKQVALSHELSKLNQKFFSTNSLDQFVSQFSDHAAPFSVNVIQMRPNFVSKPESRTQNLIKFIKNKSAENTLEIISSIQYHHRALNQEEGWLSTFKEILKIIPEEYRYEMMMIANDSKIDPYAVYNIQKVEINTILEGPFLGIVKVLDWLDSTPKFIHIIDLKMKAHPTEKNILKAHILIVVFVLLDVD